jgi:hypothetical protein
MTEFYQNSLFKINILVFVQPLSVRAGGEPVKPVADFQRQRELILKVFVHDVHAVAGRSGQDHIAGLAVFLGIGPGI